MKSKVLDAQMELLHRNEVLSIENFKIKLMGTEEHQRMLVPIFQDHNNKIKELVGKEYATLLLSSILSNSCNGNTTFQISR